MNLTKLEAVLVIAELGSMRQAAERLHCSQPALSQIVKSVERELGVELFERRRSGLQVNPGLERLLGEIRQAVEQGNRIREIARDLAQGISDRIDIMVVNSACETVVPLFLHGWRESHPDISLHIQSTKPSTQVRAILAKQTDAGILRLPINVTGIVTHAILSEELVVAVPESWLVENTLPDDLHQRPMIRFPNHHGPGIVEQVTTALGTWGMETEEHIHVDDMTCLLAMVAGRCGWALVPESLSDRHPHCIRYIPLPEAVRQASTIELGLAVREDDERPVLAAVLDQLRQAAVAHKRQQWQD